MAAGQQPNSMATGWKVTSQQETYGVGPDGQATEGVKVFFTSDQGVSGSVFVPRKSYNPDNVRAAIAGYVQQLHEVQASTGPSRP